MDDTKLLSVVDKRYIKRGKEILLFLGEKELLKGLTEARQPTIYYGPTCNFLFINCKDNTHPEIN